MHDFNNLDELSELSESVIDRYRLIKYAQFVHKVILTDYGIYIPFKGELAFNAFCWHWLNADSRNCLALTLPDYINYEEVVDSYIGAFL